MNYALQNIVALCLILFTIVFAVYFLFLRQQGQYIPDDWGDLGCMHIVNVQESGLQPMVKRGVFLSLNQCIKDREKLEEGDIIAFEDNRKKKIGIITEKSMVNNKVQYTVTRNYINNETYTIQPISVLAYTTLPSEY